MSNTFRHGDTPDKFCDTSAISTIYVGPIAHLSLKRPKLVLARYGGDLAVKKPSKMVKVQEMPQKLPTPVEKARTPRGNPVRDRRNADKPQPGWFGVYGNGPRSREQVTRQPQENGICPIPQETTTPPVGDYPESMPTPTPESTPTPQPAPTPNYPLTP